jgi:hypothetical protein
MGNDLHVNCHYTLTRHQDASQRRLCEEGFHLKNVLHYNQTAGNFKDEQPEVQAGQRQHG